MNGNGPKGTRKQTSKGQDAAPASAAAGAVSSSWQTFEAVANQRRRVRGKVGDALRRRCGSEVTQVPGDGWCFFHAVSRYCRGSGDWSLDDAARIYLQALEWLVLQRDGPRKDEVAAACVPFDAYELALHRQTIVRVTGLNSAEHIDPADATLWSKLIAVLERRKTLDSIHHGSVGVELWALTQAFDLQCLIWSTTCNANIWVATLEHLTDQEAQAKVRQHPRLLELAHREGGVSGHYNILQRSERQGPELPCTPWLELLRGQGPVAVLALAAAKFQDNVAEEPRSSPSEATNSSQDDLQPSETTDSDIGEPASTGQPTGQDQTSQQNPTKDVEGNPKSNTQDELPSSHMPTPGNLVNSTSTNPGATSEPSNGLAADSDRGEPASTSQPTGEDPTSMQNPIKDVEGNPTSTTQHELPPSHMPKPGNLVNSPSNNPGATSEPSNGLAAEAETVSATVGADATNPASQHPSAASQPGSSNAAATDVEMAGSNLEPETNRANVAEDDGVWKPFETEAEENIGSDEDVAEEDANSVLSFDSSASMESQDADYEPQVSQTKTWCTPEDEAFAVVAALAAKFKAQPLLPHVLEHWKPEASEPRTGLAYPTVHCAFKACHWCADKEPCRPSKRRHQSWRICGTAWVQARDHCCGDAAQCLWAHLTQAHAADFATMPHAAIPQHYVAALLHQQDSSVPCVGWSIDRRTLRRVQSRWQESDCGALICACCARVHAMGEGGEIAYVKVNHIFQHISEESFDDNWSHISYTLKYGKHPAVNKRFCTGEWTRALPTDLFDGRSIICCPEDIRCKECIRSQSSAFNPLCPQCELPLCRSCLVRMQQTDHPGIPQALANDNWYGYPLELLYTEKVRWIEAAAACPVWTSVVAYYLEADRGHLLEESLHRAEHRSAICGNVSSFSLPWEEVLATLDPKHPAHKTWGSLPHEPEVLRTLLKITVKGMRHNETIQWVAGAKIRPWVVVKLLHHLIDIQHPMCEAAPSEEAAKAAVVARVTAAYGTEETEPMVESVTAAEDLSPIVPTSGISTGPSKHATPETGTGASLSGEAFQGNTRPNICSQDYSNRQYQDPDIDLVARVAQATDNIVVDTGHTFWDQWRTDFLHWAFPFSLPAPVGGPDFPQAPRPRRGPSAARFNPLTHLKHLAGRVESSIRNSWDLVPGLRRITFKWHSVWGGSLWRRWQHNRHKLEAVPQSEWVQAAQRLYNKLQSGTYLSADGLARPIAYDARKLHFAKGLTAPEKQLLDDIRNMQTSMPGSIEVRRRIGRFLFGARVEFGEPLFITVSPSTRHNGLTLRLSRYRQKDPGSTPWSGQDQPPVWETGTLTIGFPAHALRRELTARDPWAVVLTFQTVIRLVFAKLLGVRMCFRCPDCDCRDAAGQSCHPTGGIFGLVRAICGAIEYQVNSTPHYHCNVYLACVWQRPLHELLAKLENQSITAADIYNFQAWIHREHHPLWEEHRKEEEQLEADWKDNYSQPQHDKLALWPQFVAADTEPSPWINTAVSEFSLPAAAEYIQKYEHIVQRKFSHQQCHWHPWNPTHKCRLPLAGCKKKGAPNKCKHGFPKKLNPVARVICRGNARKFAKSTRGRQNALGQFLGFRQDPWLSGTATALAACCFGNSHTSLNFRIPLCRTTHDPDCDRNCLDKETLPKLQRAMSQAARRSTRYFTGYLQKPQPVGKKELQQASKQLHFLNATATDAPGSSHYRKVVQRVFGDLEFRCSVRPTTEEFMLAGFGDLDDPTSAECIRTFPVVPFVGADWLNVLDNFFESRHKVQQPHARRNAEFKHAEIYGWRGADPRVFYLSPWEFTKLWTVRKLQPPSTAATSTGFALSDWVSGSQPAVKPSDGWKFGRDFVWKKNCSAAAEAAIVRIPRTVNHHVAEDHFLQRRIEPHIPFPTMCPLPKPDMSKEAQARLLNVYLRPWTLDGVIRTAEVPHIASLDIPVSATRANNPRQRLTSKTAVSSRSHRTAWQDYLRHHVVSEHAARTIRNFLAAAECSPEDADPLDPASLPERAPVDTTWVDAATVDRLTQGVGFEYSKRSGPAVRHILEQWRPDSDSMGQTWTVPASLDELSPSPTEPAAQGAADPKKPDPVRWTYGALTPDSSAAWLQGLQTNSEHSKPTQEQVDFLQAVIDRCMVEQTEEQRNPKTRSEPLRCLFHGVPGAGKSQTLKWLRAFFENVCGWEHQKEFVYLAPQNTQAALIHGITLHSFANIRVKSKSSETSKTGGPEAFVQYQRLRWVILDECSTVGLEVLGTLEKKLSQATRDKGTWKLAPNGRIRHFGGVNLAVTGDMWQFPPVKAAALFQNPFVQAESVQVRALQKFFWSRGPTGINRLFELTREQRCSDPWLSSVLYQARHGHMSHEVWCFLHGYPTIHPGSWDVALKTVGCKSASCQALATEWEVAAAAKQRPEPWETRRRRECQVCQQERHRRRIVGKNQQAEKFLYQPFAHGLNAAKYIAANLRARRVAALEGKTLLWVVAQDQPLFHMDTDDIFEQRARRENWLQRHDQATGGIVGLLPLLRGMPVRITQTLPDLKQFGLFKNTRGTLWNWTLHPTDRQGIAQSPAPDIVLQDLPVALYVQIADATWTQHRDLPPGVAILRPVVQQWQLETHGKATIARRGFPVACDFSGTAHSFMGSTLPACTLDLGMWDSTPSREAQLSGYMCLSRVKQISDLCIAQPFSPNLFTNGDLIGPQTLLDFHRQNLTLEQAKARFDKDAPKKKRHPDIMLYCCRCSPQPAGSDKLLPLREFVTGWDPEAWLQILAKGMDRVCTQCLKQDQPAEPANVPSSAKVCAFCAIRPAQRTGYCSKCEADEHPACAKCDVGKKLNTRCLTDFDPEEIRRRRQTKEMRRARCKKCTNAVKAEYHVELMPAWQCQTCRSTEPRQSEGIFPQRSSAVPASVSLRADANTAHVDLPAGGIAHAVLDTPAARASLTRYWIGQLKAARRQKKRRTGKAHWNDGFITAKYK
ncbi:unnamed protein product [Durusdinium trenchii]|uniref:ATP-dependent DNA helicase n=1 Tax=Durusdinium trenchii TaxID=1381693 RepID=A0ABP0KZV9_9DINO